jgi:hypothetical protein
MTRKGHVHQRHAPYHLLSVGGKQRALLASWRDLELVRCEACGAAVERHDAHRHAAESCPGSRIALHYSILSARRR